MLDTRPIISRETLKQVADARLAEANALIESGHYAGAIYLAGYAAECYLKLAACVTLNWDHLYGAFRDHDLEALLLYSGLDKELRSDQEIYQSFVKIMNTWPIRKGPDKPEHVRYSGPGDFDEEEATAFLSCVSDMKAGVVPWLQSRV